MSHAETWISKVVSCLLKCLLLIGESHLRFKAANLCSTVLFEATNKIAQNSSRLQNNRIFALVMNANVWLSSFRYYRYILYSPWQSCCHFFFCLFVTCKRDQIRVCTKWSGFVNLDSWKVDLSIGVVVRSAEALWSSEFCSWLCHYDLAGIERTEPITMHRNELCRALFYHWITLYAEITTPSFDFHWVISAITTSLNETKPRKVFW